MESNLPLASPEPYVPMEQTSPAKSKFVIIILSLLEIITLLAAVYFAFKFFKLQENSGNPTPAPAEASKDENSQKPPDGWEFNSANCSVDFPIPPKEENEDGRFWDFPRGAIHPNLLTKLDGAEYKQDSAMFATEDEASGYIAAAVAVSCMINGDGVSNSDVKRFLEERLTEYNDSDFEKGQEAQKYNLISVKEVNKWGKDVWEVKVEEYFDNPGGDSYSNENTYYMLATDEYLYEIRAIGATENNSVKETAIKILNGLQFK